MNMNMKIKFLLAFALLGSTAWGELVRNPYPGVRPSGMGNAFLAISDDANALWYNPAGLTKVKGTHLSLIDTSLAVDSIDTFGRLWNGVFKGDTANIIRTDQQFMRFNFRPTLVMPNFSFTIYSHANSFSRLDNLTDLDANVDIYAFNDIGAAVGFGIPLGPYFSIGATTRVFQRAGIDAELTGVELLTALGLSATLPSQQQVLSAVYQQLSALSGVGLGIAVDLGSQLTIPMPKGYPKWTLAATMNDVGATTFRPLITTRQPARVEQSIHFGTALQFDLGKSGVFNLAFDYRNAFEALPFIKQANLGLEWRHRVFGIRAGATQGYWTAGASLEFPPSTRVHVSSYAVELGQSAWQSEYRVYMIQIALGFNPL